LIIKIYDIYFVTFSGVTEQMRADFRLEL